MSKMDLVSTRMYEALTEAGEAEIAQEFKALYKIIVEQKNFLRFRKEGEVKKLDLYETVPYVYLLLLLAKSMGENAYYKFTMGVKICEYDDMPEDVDVEDLVKLLDDILDFAKYLAFMFKRCFEADEETAKSILKAMFV